MKKELGVIIYEPFAVKIKVANILKLNQKEMSYKPYDKELVEYLKRTAPNITPKFGCFPLKKSEVCFDVEIFSAEIESIPAISGVYRVSPNVLYQDKVTIFYQDNESLEICDTCIMEGFEHGPMLVDPLLRPQPTKQSLRYIVEHILTSEVEKLIFEDKIKNG